MYSSLLLCTRTNQMLSSPLSSQLYTIVPPSGIKDLIHRLSKGITWPPLHCRFPGLPRSSSPSLSYNIPTIQTTLNISPIHYRRWQWYTPSSSVWSRLPSRCVGQRSNNRSREKLSADWWWCGTKHVTREESHQRCVEERRRCLLFERTVRNCLWCGKRCGDLEDGQSGFPICKLPAGLFAFEFPTNAVPSMCNKSHIWHRLVRLYNFRHTYNQQIVTLSPPPSQIRPSVVWIPLQIQYSYLLDIALVLTLQ